MICQDCGKDDETVKVTNCPFQEEIHGIINKIIICKACYERRLEEI